MSASNAVTDLRLSCQPGKEGQGLVCDYRVENLGPTEAYVMHALPGIDPESRAARANDQALVVILGSDGDVIVGKFVAPLPTDRRVAMPVFPLARRVSAGQAIESRLVIPLPLAEGSPYFGDLPLRRYEMVDIQAVVFTIGYWAAGTDGLVALAGDHAPELFTVVTRDTARSAALVTQRFPTRGLQLFKRTDQFPRVIALAADARGVAPVSRVAAA
jgi:hypothetical protein